MTQKFIVCIMAASVFQVATANSPALDEDAATVCLDVGVRAVIQGLDDIDLKLADNQERRDGDVGARYEGRGSFFLESNAPVRVLVSAGPLSNGLKSLTTTYQIDTDDGIFETSSYGGHAAEHELKVKTQLGTISSQLAGEYSSTLVLTVIPQLTNRKKCQSGITTSLPTEETSISTELELKVNSPSSNQIEDLQPKKSLLQEEVYNSIPPQFIEIMNSPDAVLAFPLLYEFRLWENGHSPYLSDQARYWWMFPEQESVLKKILGR